MKKTTILSGFVALVACACAGNEQKGDAAASPDAAEGREAGAERAQQPDLAQVPDGAMDVALADTPAASGFDVAAALDVATAVDAGAAVDMPAAVDATGAVDVAGGTDVPGAVDAAGTSSPVCNTFKSEDGSQLYLDNLQMLSPSLGYGVKAQNGGLVDIHRTTDGGRNWTKLTTLDTGNSGSGASWAIGFYPDELWLSTYFSGIGTNGTLLRSLDGVAWERMESGIRALWNDLAEPIGTIAKVLSTQDLFVVAGDGRKALAVTANHGATWRRLDLPVQSASVAATKSHLFLRANTSSSSNDWSLYRLVSDSLQELKGRLPADFWLTRWAVAVQDDVVTLVDDEASHTPGFGLVASSDGGATFATLLQHGASGDADGYLLRRGISLGNTAFASLGRSGVRVRITRTRDGGATWTTLLEESTSNDHYYGFHTDFQGNAYAVQNAYYSTAVCLLER
ncbi:MAG: hypothetical protein JXP73_02270 [Deltaproteobacteria bacterium]|nr:hypothetical protein [Deltaproteobacteria bacterium]